MSSAQLIVALCVVLILVIVFYLVTSKRKESFGPMASGPGEFKLPAAGTRLSDGSIFTKQMRDEYKAFGVGNPFFVTNNNDINASLKKMAANPKTIPDDVLAVLYRIMWQQLFDPLSPNNYSLLYPVLNMDVVPSRSKSLYNAIFEVSNNFSIIPSVTNVVKTVNALIPVLSSANLSQLQADAVQAIGPDAGPQYKFPNSIAQSENQLRAIISQLQTCVVLLQKSVANWRQTHAASKK